MYLTYQLIFIANFLICYLLMKLVSWLATPKNIREGKGKLFILSPYLSVRSLEFRARSHYALPARFVFFLLLTASFLVMGNQMEELSVFEIMMLSPLIYFFTELAASFGQLLFFFNPTFPIHKNPVFSSSLSRFWGRDWNLWVQDWLRDVTHMWGRKGDGKRIVLVFLVSGLFHEFWCNFPYWFLYKRSYFGTMMAYFFIQALALWIDKKFMRQFSGFWRRVYLWIAVILPSPLFINVPVLTFFGLKHD